MPIYPVGAPGEPGDALILTPPASSSVPVAVETAPDPELDGSSAAIGAAAGTGLFIVALAAGGLAWRRPVTAGTVQRVPEELTAVALRAAS